MTHNTATTVGGTIRTISAQDDLLTKLGHPGTWNASILRLDVSVPADGLGFYADAADFEIQWFKATAAKKYWIWVDGAAITAEPKAPVTLFVSPDGVIIRGDWPVGSGMIIAPSR